MSCLVAAIRVCPGIHKVRVRTWHDSEGEPALPVSYNNNNNNNNKKKKKKKKKKKNDGTYVWMVILHVAVEVETVMWLPSHFWMQFGPVQKK